MPIALESTIWLIVKPIVIFAFVVGFAPAEVAIVDFLTHRFTSL